MASFLAPLAQWIEQWLLALHPASLFVLSFIESIFFPIPPDVVLLPLSALQPDRALFFALLTTIGSVSGASLGYVLGYGGGRPILRRLVSPQRIQQAEDLMNRYDVWAIAIAGFTPVPYKVFAIASGVFRVWFPRFLVVSFMSRGTRFLLEGLLIRWYGETMVAFISRHFEWLTLAVMAVVVAGYVIVNRMRKQTV